MFACMPNIMGVLKKKTDFCIFIVDFHIRMIMIGSFRHRILQDCRVIKLFRRTIFCGEAGDSSVVIISYLVEL